jgi:hypothetical protein
MVCSPRFWIPSSKDFTPNTIGLWTSDIFLLRSYFGHLSPFRKRKHHYSRHYIGPPVGIAEDFVLSCHIFAAMPGLKKEKWSFVIFLRLCCRRGAFSRMWSLPYSASDPKFINRSSPLPDKFHLAGPMIQMCLIWL